VSLAQAYYALAAALLLAAYLVFTASPVLQTFRRSRFATVTLTLAATAWFGWWLMNMPEPDLAGLPRLPVVVVLLGASLATLRYMPDLLSIRSLGVLMLFLARFTLDAGYRQLPRSLLDATLSYGLFVVFGLWWAYSPPTFLNQCDWVLRTPARHKGLGIILGLLAVACLLASFVS
jgi:hypothetical protein